MIAFTLVFQSVCILSVFVFVLHLYLYCVCIFNCIYICVCVCAGGGYFLVKGYWGYAAGWGRIFETGLTIMGLHF